MFKLSICSKFVYKHKMCDFLLYLSKDFTKLGFKHNTERKIPRKKKNKVIIKILILRKYLEKSHILRKFLEKILILRIRMLVNTSPDLLYISCNRVSDWLIAQKDLHKIISELWNLLPVTDSLLKCKINHIKM